MKPQHITKCKNPHNFIEVIHRLSAIFEKRDFELKTVYFDYGQNWLHETIIATSKGCGDGYQILNPRDWKLVDSGEIDKAIANIIEKQSDLLSK